MATTVSQMLEIFQRALHAEATMFVDPRRKAIIERLLDDTIIAAKLVGSAQGVNAYKKVRHDQRKANGLKRLKLAQERAARKAEKRALRGAMSNERP